MPPTKRLKAAGPPAAAVSAGRRAPTWPAAAALMLVMVGLSLTPIRDCDTWWHLKTGQLVLHSGIPRSDPFSYALQGRSWVSMEWLSEVFFFAALRAGGPSGLIGFKAALLTAAFLLLWRLRRDRPYWGFAALSLCALAARPSFVERPFVFDFLMLGVLASLLWDAPFRRPPRRLYWALPLVAALWANLHGGAAALAPVLVALAAAAERLRDPEVPLGCWAGIILLCSAALLVNPHGWGVLADLWGTLAFPGKEAIRDWHPPTYQYRGLYGALLAAGLAASWAAFRSRPFLAVWTAAAAAASTRMERNIALYALLCGPTLVSALPSRVPPVPGPLGAAAVVLGVGGAVWARLSWGGPLLPGRFGLGTEEPLAGASAFLDEAALPGKMFNEYESGGYLIWKGYPRRKVFIDGRNLLYGPDLTRQALAWYQPAQWEALDSRWSFDYAVVARHVTGAYTARVLEDSPEWAPVYWDDTAMVYLRRRPEHEPWLRRYAYRLLKPGRSVYQYLEPLLERPDAAAALLAELDRSVVEARGSCVNALLMKAYLLARLRRWEDASGACLQAAARFPGRAQPRFTLGWILEAAGESERAQAQYLLALSLVGGEERAGLGADILNNLGRLRERRGDLASAREYYRRSLGWNPGQGDALRNLGRIERGGAQ